MKTSEPKRPVIVRYVALFDGDGEEIHRQDVLYTLLPGDTLTLR